MIIATPLKNLLDLYKQSLNIYFNLTGQLKTVILFVMRTTVRGKLKCIKM